MILGPIPFFMAIDEVHLFLIGKMDNLEWRQSPPTTHSFSQVHRRDLTTPDPGHAQIWRSNGSRSRKTPEATYDASTRGASVLDLRLKCRGAVRYLRRRNFGKFGRLFAGKASPTWATRQYVPLQPTKSRILDEGPNPVRYKLPRSCPILAISDDEISTKRAC